MWNTSPPLLLLLFHSYLPSLSTPPLPFPPFPLLPSPTFLSSHLSPPSSPSLFPFPPLPFLLLHTGAGTFGTVRAGIYRPKNGEPEAKCAIKCLKPTEELPNQTVYMYMCVFRSVFVSNGHLIPMTK